MKKLFFSFFLFVTILFKAVADEGMWLPLLLGQQAKNNCTA